jgi:dTDP-4-dehydrorhamnose 3,5-epimerase
MSLDRFVSYKELAIKGAYLISYVGFHDSRGTFTKKFFPEIFSILGENELIAQVNYSENTKRGTFRGMHVQGVEWPESKVICCIQGRALDILIDLRPESQTFGKNVLIELCAEDNTAILISPGIAHGYQTLKDDTTFLYAHNKPWNAEYTEVLSIQDPDLEITLPLPINLISIADKNGKSLSFFGQK